MISAGLGRYGPFVLHDGTYANLEAIEDVFSIGLNRAVTVIAEKAAKGPGRGRGTPAALKALGEHPDGRRTDHRARRPLRALRQSRQDQRDDPQEQGPDVGDLEDAVKLIAERAEKSGKKVGGAKAKKERSRPRRKRLRRRRKPPPRRMV
jgi:DNA topoisomerase-1